MDYQPLCRAGPSRTHYQVLLNSGHGLLTRRTLGGPRGDTSFLAATKNMVKFGLFINRLRVQYREELAGSSTSGRSVLVNASTCHNTTRSIVCTDSYSTTRSIVYTEGAGTKPIIPNHSVKAVADFANNGYLLSSLFPSIL